MSSELARATTLLQFQLKATRLSYFMSPTVFFFFPSHSLSSEASKIAHREMSLMHPPYWPMLYTQSGRISDRFG